MGKNIWSPFHRIEHEPPHYQDLLGEVMIAEGSNVCVESGTESGFGAEYLVKALERNNHGHLYSFDPHPHSHMINLPIVSPRFTLIEKYSHEIMVPFFLEHGPYDMFLHDSDHGPGCQTFEYELAWYLVRRGGLIVTDDRWWGIGPDSTPHHSWENFLKRHELTNERDVKVIGAAAYIKKPESGPEPRMEEAWAREAWVKAAALANDACAKWGLPPYLAVPE